MRYERQRVCIVHQPTLTFNCDPDVESKPQPTNPNLNLTYYVPERRECLHGIFDQSPRLNLRLLEANQLDVLMEVGMVIGGSEME